ncbi:hypothetical protein LZC95_40635 [Pendulispora brunnea]|uniref:Cytochrome c domain-containing protein n=1 Tax=Pendulispora brunnea TaxID=2905690 RepID=A0ABZ2K292_9BACT
MRAMVSAKSGAAVMAAAMLIGSIAACGSSSDNGGNPPGSDAGPGDAGPGDAGTSGPPQRLSETGLYSDMATKQVAAASLEYAPAYALWSDAADKKRWIVLPAGARIDTTDMDHWRFPVGTKLFKEFSRGGKRLETRLIEHVADTGKLEDDYLASTFVWRDDESDADLAVDGARNIRGTDHDVPSRQDCFKCHRGEPGAILGFSAIQLFQPSAPASAMTLRRLVEQGKLTAPPAADANFSAPGDEATARAFGYLHANCGHCHNENGIAWADNPMKLRLLVGERDAATSSIYKATVKARMDRPKTSGDEFRVVAGHPEKSGLFYRMSLRDGTPESMPPIATKHVDSDAVSVVKAWIERLPPSP